MYRHFIILLLSFKCFVFILKAGGTDSLVKYHDLNLKWEIEKAAFKAYAKNDLSDATNLFLKSFGKETGFDAEKANNLINTCVSDLKNKIKGQSEAKAIKIIYKEIHQRFFKVYQLQNSFSSVFEKGEYNCVSGSAMYALVFHKMSIPYQILEAPQHVFLMAYPTTHKIMIETTSPQNGYYTFNDAYIQRFINYMVSSKLISQEEKDKTSTAELFNKYYFKQNGMSLIELAAAQYANYAVYHLEKDEYEAALSEIQKAYYLSPNEKHRYVLRTVLDYLITNNDYKDLKRVHYLEGLCAFNNYTKDEISNEKIKYEFIRVMRDQLIEESNYAYIERSFEIINEALTDTVLKKEISFMYNYEMARLGHTKYKDKNYLLPFLKAAYRSNSKDQDLQSLILSVFLRIIDNSNDVPTISKLMDEFESNFGFLKSHAGFNSVRANCLLELCYQHYLLTEYSKGDKVLLEFETLCDSNKDIKPGDRFVEKAYSSVATYYYKKGNVAKTKQVLKKGLLYSPDNFGLKIRLNQLH